MHYSELSLERVREFLHYDPETGHWTRLKSNSNRTKLGPFIPCKTDGYHCIRVDTCLVVAHRLAWFYHYGEWPSKFIDHINGVRDDNRISNLRDVSNAENLQNRYRPLKNSSTGLLGASRHSDGKYCAWISINGKQKYLGLYKTAEEAHAAYIGAKRILHPKAYIPV